jgi:hypothetical protein
MRVVALAVALSFLALPARAEEEICGTLRPFVELHFEGRPFTPDFVASLLGDLGAGLREQGIDACSEPQGNGQPVARVTLRSSTGEPLRIGIEVSDAVTDKRLERTVDLERLPEDGRAFALAVATDELLRASWVELRLSRREPPPQAPPPEVSRAVERALPSTPRASENGLDEPALGLRLATEHFTAGQTHFGLDGVFHWPVSGQWGLEFSFGGRKALDERAPHGTIAASALGGSVMGLLTLLEAPSLALDFGLGARALRVAFDASGEEGAVAEDQARFALTSRAALGLRVGGMVRASLQAGGGLPLVAVKASEGTQVVTGVAGAELFLATGLEVAF